MGRAGRPRTKLIMVRLMNRTGRGLTFHWTEPSGRRGSQLVTATGKDAIENERAELQLRLRREHGCVALDWTAFRNAAAQRFVAPKSHGYKTHLRRVFDVWEDANGLMEDVSKIGSTEIARFQAKIREISERKRPAGGVKSDATVAKDLRALKALLNWGRKNGYIREVAHIEMPKRRRGFLGKSRPIDQVAFKRLQDAVAAHVGPDFAEGWRIALDGLWTSGMRLGEMLALDFDRVHRSPSGAVVIRWGHGDQKSRRAETTPTTPEFAALIESLPYREGRVFRPELSRGVVHAHTFSHTVDDACRAAGLKVTSHDLRRSFADRWSRKVTPMVLSRLMRCSMAVIRNYYAELESESIGEELLRTFGSEKAAKIPPP